MQAPSNNRLLRELGFDKSDRVVVIHADDLGMCEATVGAFTDLVEFGLVSSGSVMVPCPWFPAIASWCRDHSEADVGVHLTLTSEWTNYRWGPVSSRNVRTGLLDREGYFHRDRQSLWENVSPEAAAKEMRAQVSRAKAAGIDVTHVDTHMFTAFHPVLFHQYLDVASECEIPAMVLRDASTEWVRALGSNRMIKKIEQQGYPVFDFVCVLGLRQPVNDRMQHTQEAFDSLPAGLSCFLLHPARSTPELRAIVPDWQCRVADYEVFTRSQLRNYLRKRGIQVISYRMLRDAVRTTAAARERSVS